VGLGPPGLDEHSCAFRFSVVGGDVVHVQLEHQVAATPMTDAWGGPVATKYLRLVFGNESVER
jgi:hypothetical protein